MRYAGYHISNYIRSNYTNKNSFDDSIKHCTRAKFDSKEAVIIYFLRKIEDFMFLNGDEPSICEIIENYPKMLANVCEISDFFSDIKRHHYDDRFKYYQECEPKVKELESIQKEFSVASPLIQQKAIQEKNKEINTTRKFVIKTIIGIITTLILLITLIVKFWDKIFS